jgi:3-hydroxyacyl-[acyl-carrier-protein] dehydratase
MSKLIDIKEIMRVIPHRYPFLLIDRIISHVPGEKLVALKNVTINEEFFQGHFPGEPVMPGVLIIEAMAQAAAYFAMQSLPAEKRKGAICYLAKLDNVRFKEPVVPGDSLHLHVEQERMKSSLCKMVGHAQVGDKVVAEANLTAILK